MNPNLYAVLTAQSLQKPDRPFLDTGATQWTFGDIDTLSAKFAGVLAARNVQVGDRVVVQVEKTPEAVALYLACLRFGAIFIPLNTSYTPSEVRYFLQDAEPAMFVCDPSFDQDKISDLAVATVMTMDASGAGTATDAAGAAIPFKDIRTVAKNDLAAILYTSGTTGRSKGAMLTHENLSSNVKVLCAEWKFSAEDVLLHALPIFHVHGLFVALHCAMLSGCTVKFHAKFDIAKVMADLNGCTVMMGVPTFYARLLAQPEFSCLSCGDIRLFISGSAPLTAQMHQEFEKRTGMRILERYGMTEAGMITSNPYDGDRIAGTVGMALPDVLVRVIGTSGEHLVNEVGSIQVRGPNVFKGYWKMPEKTAEEFTADGYFITGDLGTIDGNGRVTIVGRGKDLIISGGYNIYPKEIENVLDDVEGVGESAVIGVPHPDFGEAVVAVIVAQVTEDLPQRLKAAVGENLAKFKHPKSWVFVSDLPRNTMGKVQKNILRETYRDAF